MIIFSFYYNIRPKAISDNIPGVSEVSKGNVPKGKDVNPHRICCVKQNEAKRHFA